MIKLGRNRYLAAFTFTEILIALVLGAILSIGAYNFFKKQERKYITEKLTGDVESLSRVAFFLIGRDIRRAGSNPSQAVPASISGDAAAPIPFPVAQPDSIQIQADLNADGDVLDLDEDITYVYIDSDGDGENDQIRRDPSAGDLIVIENVEEFTLSYIMASGGEVDYPNPTSLIKKIRIVMTVEAGRNNPETGEPITQTFETIVKLRNFQ